MNNSTNLLKAILLMGPTATGKTNLALNLANNYPIEIISVDSALIYQGMNIGTAKPDKAEMELVPHHLINIITPLEAYSVAEFVHSATKLITEITLRGKIPVLVGGTMMYFNALLNGLSELPAANQAMRELLESRVQSEGLGNLYQELVRVDPLTAAKLMSADKQRILRALEVYYTTAIALSTWQHKAPKIRPTNIEFLNLAILPIEREDLHQRINKRFEMMIGQGFIEEVKHLQKVYPELTNSHTSMRSVGYFQVWEYLEGKISLPELTEMGKAATRQLAKRQITWLRSMDVINIATVELSLSQLHANMLEQIRLFLM